MRDWFRNIWIAIHTVASGMAITLGLWLRTYRRRTFTEVYEYPEVPVPVKARYRGFHRFDLTACIACDRCAVACPVDCIYIEKSKSPPARAFASKRSRSTTPSACSAPCVSIPARSIASSWARPTT